MFSGGTERSQWHEMGEELKTEFKNHKEAKSSGLILTLCAFYLDKVWFFDGETSAKI